MSDKREKFLKPHKNILLILLIGFIHGIIYVFLVPPWQHYDEPGNFEYAWLIAAEGDIPDSGTYDQPMRRELAASMVENDFFGDDIPKPNLLSYNEPIWIGIPQTGDSSLYYQLIAIPLGLITSSDITLQLYAGRMISSILYLVTILASYGVANTLTSENNPIRWMLPLTLALLPGFTDLMTAINNDVGAVAIFSVFLWLSLRLIQLGFSWGEFLVLILASLLCLLTKSTVVSAVPLAFIALLFSILQENNRKYAWGILIITALGAFIIVFNIHDAAHWQHVTTQTGATRAKIPETPIGDYSLQLNLPTNSNKTILSQSIVYEKAIDLIEGKNATFGAWIWADVDRANITITLYDEMEQIMASQTFDLSDKPKFHEIAAKIPKDIQKIQIALSASNPDRSIPASIFFDGIILIPGNHTETVIPECLDVDCNQVAWGGINYFNLILNSSAERGWPSIQPEVSKYIAKIIPISNPATTLNSLLNWRTNQLYFKATIENLLRTFWAKFGWGHVSLLGHKPYRILTILTVITITGTLVRLIRLRREMPWPSLVFLVIALTLIWSSALVRGLTSTLLFSNFTYIPVARYAYPAIIPTALILNLGWLEITDQADYWFKIPKIYLCGIYIAFFIGLDILSIVSIYKFYY